jgi:hypothetical protein
MFSSRWIGKDKASRSKSVAEVDVGSLWFVDRSESFIHDSPATPMNAAGHFSAMRPRFTSSRGATSRGDAFLPIASRWDRAAPRLAITAGTVLQPRMHSFARLRTALGGSKMSSALFEESAKNSPQGASPPRLLADRVEGPVLCLMSVPSHSTFLSRDESLHPSLLRATGGRRTHHRFETQ